MDRQITDFLNKQNALVQNLSQQIESYLGVSNALSAELATMRTQIEQFTSKFKADATGLSQRLTTQDKTLQALLQRIEEIEDKLAKKSWLPWRK
jgi:septation ring formation regulator EzrA